MSCHAPDDVATADAATSTGFDALADRDGVLVAYPSGIKRSFNAGLCCGEAVVQEIWSLIGVELLAHLLHPKLVEAPAEIAFERPLDPATPVRSRPPQ